MRTTLDLDAELVRRALKETGTRTKTKVVEKSCPARPSREPPNAAR
jgi:Arc/MetJ family transcription regulator